MTQPPPPTPPPAPVGPGPISAYPVTFDVVYPDHELDRLTTFFRLFMLIPIGIILALVSGSAGGSAADDAQSMSIAAGGLLFFPVLLMILFRGKYPRWWFDWNLQLARFGARVGAYAALLDDQYPSTDEEQSVRLDLPYPDVANDLNRGLPIVKWFLAIPHYIVLVFLGFFAFWAVVFAWFAILFTGRYPRGLFDFVVGVFRWWTRVYGYAFILVTDKYPPFRLAP